MKKRWISLLLVSAMTLSMLAGCGSSEDPAEDTSEGGEGDKITFMVPDWGVPTDEQLAAFTEETGIEVEIAEVGWDDIREKIATAASANECAADVVEVDWSWVGEFYAADWLEPLEVSDEDKEDMPTIETFTVDDKVLAMPYANDYRLAYYNTEQFAQAGITEDFDQWNKRKRSEGTLPGPERRGRLRCSLRSLLRLELQKSHRPGMMFWKHAGL